MSEQCFDQTTECKAPRYSRVRACLKQSAASLGERANLLSLALSLLFCLVVGFAIYMMVTILGQVLYHLTLLHADSVNLICALVLCAAVLFALLPLLVGRVRMAGLIARGETPLVKESFYYFTAGRRYGRGVVIGVLYLFSLAAPVVLTAFAFWGAYQLYVQVLTQTLPEVLAAVLVALCYHVCAALGVLFLFLAGIWLPSVAIAVGNEHVSPFKAFRLGIVKGCRNLGASARFSLYFLLRALFSLLTVGVLWLLYYGQLVTVAYMSFSELICHE